MKTYFQSTIPFSKIRAYIDHIKMYHDSIFYYYCIYKNKYEYNEDIINVFYKDLEKIRPNNINKANKLTERVEEYGELIDKKLGKIEDWTSFFKNINKHKKEALRILRKNKLKRVKNEKIKR